MPVANQAQVKYMSVFCITMTVFVSMSASYCVYKIVSAKVISESSRPPGGSLINLVAFMAACKHNTELQLCCAQSSEANPAKGAQGSSEDATLLIVCLCLWVRERVIPLVCLQPQVANHSCTHFHRLLLLLCKRNVAIYRDGKPHPQTTQ